MVGIPTEIIASALAAGAATGAASYATFAPTCSWCCPLISRGSTDGPARVALTFDDGPLPGATDRILEVLLEMKVKAAFFVVGQATARHPELLRRIHDEGHLVGNHSFDHPGLGFLRGAEFWRRQIDQTDEVIEREIGVSPRLFRPPLGMKTWMIARAARTQTVVTWNRRAMDGVATTSEKILRRLLTHTCAGDIILMHDGVSPQSRRDPSATVEAVRPLILGLLERGIKPVRLDELTRTAAYAGKQR